MGKQKGAGVNALLNNDWTQFVILCRKYSHGESDAPRGSVRMSRRAARPSRTGRKGPKPSERRKRREDDFGPLAVVLSGLSCSAARHTVTQFLHILQFLHI